MGVNAMNPRYHISFGPDYVSLHAIGRNMHRGIQLVGMMSYIDGETALECAKRIARRFRAEMRGIRGALRVMHGCELPCEQFARFGWTRETRPIGDVSVKTDGYDVL